MNTAELFASIRTRLEEHLAPVSLELIDESAGHAGHAGARTGKGYVRVHIVSRMFAGKTPLQCHRMIYEALGELMQNDIHALTIEASAPSS